MAVWQYTTFKFVCKNNSFHVEKSCLNSKFLKEELGFEKLKKHFLGDCDALWEKRPSDCQHTESKPSCNILSASTMFLGCEVRSSN